MSADPMPTAHTAATEESQFQNPELECDVVMKGGITSGLVYPAAVLQLAPKYRFRSIGGTSAGAIAAALTAAAEYGRQAGGFEKLKEVNQHLGEENGLLSLFQAQPRTQPLLDIVLEVLRLPETGSNSRETLAGGILPAISQFGRIAAKAAVPRVKSWGGMGLVAGVAIAAAIAAVLALIQLATGTSVSFSVLLILVVTIGVPLALIFYWLGRRVGAVFSLYEIATQSVPENHYGICNGMNSGTLPSLTPWMSESINSLAGRSSDGPPLTFADLISNPSGKPIVLRTITSNLSHNRPYEMPFQHHIWIAKTTEFAQLFPASVMTYLLKNSPSNTQAIPPDGYFYLPPGDELPVIVAARMSMSFPVLISAVPLYTVKPSAYARRDEDNRVELTEDDLQRNWFSDGGTCSNFPIHFFDSWLPGRPTFGFKLTDFPDEAFDAPGGQLRADFLTTLQAPAAAPDTDPGTVPAATVNAAADSSHAVDPIYLSPANRPPQPEWTPIDNPNRPGTPARPNLFRFLWSIFSTAQNYRDNMQSDLPSYRERIVQIRLKESEGGLNLAMDKDTVGRVMAKGTMAAERLLQRFSFPQHQWVRMLTIAARLEAAAEEMDQSLANGAFDPTALFDLQLKDEKFPYRRYAWWRGQSARQLKSAFIFIKAWSGKHFRSREPLPVPVLRVTPKQ